MQLKENLILLDWLSFTSKIHTQNEIISMLGLEGVTWQDLKGKGMYGYRDRLYFNSISIHYNGNSSVWCEMSGQGCRAYETHGRNDYSGLFEIIKKNEDYINITRLDIACDDFNFLDMKKISDDVDAKNYKSPMTAWETVKSNKGLSVYIGSEKSDVRIRIYDKAKEKNCDEDMHWIRCEIQLRDDRAFETAMLLKNHEIGKIYNGILVNYLDFIKRNESNVTRCKRKKYWSDFISDSDKIKIYANPGEDYNKDRLESYVYNQAAGAIKTALEIDGENGFMVKVKLNNKELD